MTEEEKLSERMSSGSFSPTNDGVLTCDECGREPDDVVFNCSSHEDAENKKEAAVLEQQIEELKDYKREIEAVSDVMFQYTMRRLVQLGEQEKS